MPLRLLCVSMTGSAFRRNIAEHLGIASAANIKTKRYQPTPADAARISAFVASMELAWIECENDAAARELERRLQAEFRPPPTKR
jgi:hypothetical protein